VPALGTAVLSLLVLIRLAGVVGLLERDVSQRRALEARLRHQAYHDPLTGLANRRRFVEAAEAALEARQGPGTVAALFLDLDDFKTVNDSQGHAAGDELLATVARRIREGLRAGDLAARLGGDEFGVLLVHIPDTAFARTVSQRLLANLDVPMKIGGTVVAVGASIGIAVDTPDMHTVDDLLGAADVAMYQAKAGGKGRHQVYGAAPTPDDPVVDPVATAIDTPAQRTVRHAPPRLELEPG
jgi:diguanylate cyclase (GGDEF)-like protein